jgi:hypothetical protein
MSTGCHVDQPAFNKAIADTNIKMRILPAKYNAMVRWLRWGGCRPAVLHFFTGEWEQRRDTRFFQLVQYVVEQGEVNECAVASFVSDGYPWICNESFSRQVACGRYLKAAGRLRGVMVERAINFFKPPRT